MVRHVCSTFGIPANAPLHQRRNHQRKTRTNLKNPLLTSEDSVQEEPSPPAESSHEAPDTFQSSDNCMQTTSEQMSTSCYGQYFSGLYRKCSRMSWCSGDCVTDNSQSPWLLRRKLAAGALNPRMSGHRNVPGSKQRVLRQPFCPDSTKGFQGRRKRADAWLNNILQKF